MIKKRKITWLQTFQTIRYQMRCTILIFNLFMGKNKRRHFGWIPVSGLNLSYFDEQLLIWPDLLNYGPIARKPHLTPDSNICSIVHPLWGNHHPTPPHSLHSGPKHQWHFLKQFDCFYHITSSKNLLSKTRNMAQSVPFNPMIKTQKNT